jgi:uncharacterized protein (TIGR02246 family)
MMRTLLATLLLAVGCSEVNGQQPAAANQEDEAAIRAAIASYVEAYNRGDAHAVAEFWSDTGEWVSPDGERAVGREAIEKSMREFFAGAKDAKIEVINPRIRFVTPEVAIEEGAVRVTSPGKATSESTYIAVDVKQDGAWKLSTVCETEVRETAIVPGPLAELSWMVGDWADASAEASTETSVNWSKNNAFLISTFRMSAPDMDDFEGTQFVGWDPSTEVIRSWMFDFDAGFGAGTWSHDGDRWIVDFSQILPDGRLAPISTHYWMRIATRGSQSIARSTGSRCRT